MFKYNLIVDLLKKAMCYIDF